MNVRAVWMDQPGNFLELGLAEDDSIIKLYTGEDNRLYCVTQKGRKFVSTFIKNMKHFDMVEVTDAEQG